MCTIAFASTGLSHSESRHPAHKLEFLILKWAVTEKFSDYLYCSQFTVITDSNPFIHVLNTAILDATSCCWLAALSKFSFKLQYRAGKLNIDADSLSRRPQEPFPENSMSQKERKMIGQFIQHHFTKAEDSVSAMDEVVQAICEKHLIRQSADFGAGIALISSLSLCSDSVPDCYEHKGSSNGSFVLPHLSKDLGDKQRANPVLQEVMSHSWEKKKPTNS